jgi:diguanylate cyclase (GGDEF)-like protein
MTIKQKIWSIPLVTILIFTLGMAIIYGASSHTYNLLQGAEDTHQPYLNKIKILLNDLKGIQENFQNAIIINDRNSIALAQQKARDFHEIGREIAMLDGKKAISHRMLTQFDAYFVPAENAASIMMGIKVGDAIPDLERMLIALNKLEDTLQQEHLVATRIFGESLDNGRSNVRRMLWVNLASVVFVVIGLAYISYRLIASIMQNLEYLRTGARKISQGDFTARIPEQGKDELTLVIQSFNSMGCALQAATEKHIQYEKQLETLNRELEDRVIARTAELGVALEDANKANAAVAYMADHDTLTGLLNRRRFQEEFERWGKYALRYERAMTLMFIDLDKFKDINDIHGHLGGDEYLLAVAGLLKQVLRSTDYIGRWGGDEFVALLPEADVAAAAEAAGKLIKVLSETPFSVAGHSLRASASIGIAVLPEHTSDINELTAFADAAMYKAKEAGRGCFRLYSASAHEVQRVDEHARWAGRIRRALETDQFILFYQPQLNLKTGETAEYEALLRMEDTNGHFISPGLFLESAERFDLSIPIDRMVIRKAAYRIATLKNQKIPLRLSLNLSTKTLDDAGLINYIGDAIKEFGIDPDNLAFEISETAILQNMNRVRNLSAEITQLGCRLILDDIGVGFSSFHYLAPLSISSIKIRGDLIHNLRHAENRDYVASLCKTCRDLNIEVVAKFVEDLSMLGTLRNIGVGYAQGFAVGKPLESLGEFGVAA